MSKQIALVVNQLFESRHLQIIKNQISEKNISNITALPFGSDVSSYDIVEHNVHPNKTHGELLDLGLNFVKFGFHTTEFNPLTKTGNAEQDKLLKSKSETDQEINHLSDSLTDELEEFDFNKYTLRIEALAKKDEELRTKANNISNWTMKELARAYDYTDDITIVISIGAEIYVRKFGQPISKRGFPYKYDPKWIAEDFIQAIEKYPDQKRKWIKAIKTRARNIIKQEKNFNSLKFFPKFLVEKHEDQLQYTTHYETISEPSKERATYRDNQVTIDESEIPF